MDSASIPIQLTTVNYYTSSIKSANGPVPNVITIFSMGQIRSECISDG